MGLFALQKLELFYQLFNVFFLNKIRLALVDLHLEQHIINQIVPAVDRVFDSFGVLNQLGQVFGDLLSDFIFILNVETFLGVLESDFDDIFIFFFSEVSHVQNEYLVQDLQILSKTDKVKEEIIVRVENHYAVSEIIF